MLPLKAVLKMAHGDRVWYALILCGPLTFYQGENIS